MGDFLSEIPLYANKMNAMISLMDHIDARRELLTFVDAAFFLKCGPRSHPGT